MKRQRLPDRRPNQTCEVSHAGHAFTVTVGFDPDGSPREVFADGAKVGTDMAHVIADACVLLSLLLQHGCLPFAARKSLGRVPDPAQGEGASRAASVVGVIAQVVQDCALLEPPAGRT